MGEKSEEYGFNAIFFSRQDYTPWGQKFLIERVQDNKWIPVFVDNYAINFLKNTELSKPIIDKYEISRNYFRIIQTQ